MTFHEWLADAAEEWQRARLDRGIHIRWGQTFANRLSWDRPDIYEDIQLTALDPYYHEAVSIDTLTFVSENW
jgi:hypothetical protein